MDKNWYSSFFDGVVVETWRNAVSPEDTRRETDFLERELRLRPGQHVLDVPCGFGRHAVELARRGYRVTGMDISAEMIVAGKSRAAEAGVDIDWHNAEMREIAADAAFDAAFCFGNAFGYLDRTGTRAFLAAVSRALRPGARIALDYGMAAECILPHFQEHQWAPVGDLYFLEHNRYDLAESCIETTYTFIRAGRAETRVGLHWVYTVGEIRAMLSEAGMTTVGLYSSVEGGAFALGAPMLIVLGEKSGETILG